MLERICWSYLVEPLACLGRMVVLTIFFEHLYLIRLRTGGASLIGHVV